MLSSLVAAVVPVSGWASIAWQGAEKYSTEVPQQRLTTAGVGDRAHMVPPVPMAAITGWPVSCKQKARRSSPLGCLLLHGCAEETYAHCGLDFYSETGSPPDGSLLAQGAVAVSSRPFEPSPAVRPISCHVWKLR